MPWALSSMGLVGGRLIRGKMETRDAALRAHGPSVAAMDEAHGVVGAAVEEFPGFADVSGDNGKTWKLFDSGAYNAMSFVHSGDGWAVGPQGRIARFHLPANQPPAN